MSSAHDVIESMRRSEERLRLIAENARDTIWTMAPDGTITYVSPSVTAVRGISPEEAMRQRPEEIHPPESLARSGAYFVSMLRDLAEGRTPPPFRGDLEYYRRDGSTFWTEVLAFPILDERGQFVELLGVSRDLSDRRTREAEQRGTQRLDAMARMASGVSHEVNNALAIIQTASELLASAAADSTDVRATMATICGAVTRISALTSRLLAFSRRRPSQLSTIRTGEFMERIGPELDSMAAPAKLRLSVRDDTRSASLHVDPALLAETLDILVRNAAAGAGNDELVTVVVTRRQLADALRTRTRELAPGDYVTITVANTQRAMSAELIEHAFEPFHANPAKSDDDGLGLATVFGLTQQQQGGLTIESSAEAGTQFTLWWPESSLTSRSTPAHGAMMTVATASQQASSQRVLLVDDEPLVLRGTARMLEHFGYSVVSASSADDALALARREAFDVLVTDVRMPGKTGFDLVQSLLDSGVDLPVLFISGDVGATTPGSRSGRHTPRYLAKPFAGDELRRHLQEMAADQVSTRSRK